MLILRKKSLLLIFTVLVLILIPLLFTGKRPFYSHYAGIIFIFIILELAIYVTYILASNWSLLLFPVLTTALVLTLFRAIMCLGSLLVIHLFPIISPTTQINFVLLWMGNPLSIFLQILIIGLILPHLLREFAPGLLGKQLNKLISLETQSGEETTTSTSQTSEQPPASKVSTVYNIYSFHELDTLLTKTIGLEGFIIYNEEGLIVWQNTRIKIDAERLVIEAIRSADKIKTWTTELGLLPCTKILLETSSHCILNGFVNRIFGYILIFTRTLPLEEMQYRVSVLGESISGFLKTHYRALINSQTER